MLLFMEKTIIRPVLPPDSEAILWIAQLGGFLERKNDGFPGVKTIWRGLKRLDDIASTWLLCHNSFANVLLSKENTI